MTLQIPFLIEDIYWQNNKQEEGEENFIQTLSGDRT